MSPTRSAFFDFIRTALTPAPRPGNPVDRAVCIDDLRRIARRRLPRGVWDYLEGGAEDESTLHRNVSAFRDVRLLPKVLRDVGKVDLSTTVGGISVAAPIICAPTGYSRLFHSDGELAVSSAAAEAGLIYSLSTMGTRSIEEIAAAGVGPKWFQLYVWQDHTLVEELVARAQQARYDALCLTVDTAVLGRRERDMRNGFTIPPRVGVKTLLDGARRPRWWAGYLRAEPLTFANVASRISGSSPVAGAYVARQFDPALSWEDAARIRSSWSGTFAIKGIVRADDARRALDIGADVIVVSNHGGRQLDASVAPIDVLASVVRAADGRAEVVLDGGVRRGTDIAKALALGARAVMVGRAYLYGLAAGGRPGCARALELLTNELRSTMALLGAASIAELDESYLR